MAAIGIAVVLAGYALGMWGYCLIRGYCVTPADIVNWNFPSSMAGQVNNGQSIGGGGSRTATAA